MWTQSIVQAPWISCQPATHLCLVLLDGHATGPMLRCAQWGFPSPCILCTWRFQCAPCCRAPPRDWEIERFGWASLFGWMPKNEYGVIRGIRICGPFRWVIKGTPLWCGHEVLGVHRIIYVYQGLLVEHGLETLICPWRIGMWTLSGKCAPIVGPTWWPSDWTIQYLLNFTRPLHPSK